MLVISILKSTHNNPFQLKASQGFVLRKHLCCILWPKSTMTWRDCQDEINSGSAQQEALESQTGQTGTTKWPICHHLTQWDPDEEGPASKESKCSHFRKSSWSCRRACSLEDHWDFFSLLGRLLSSSYKDHLKEAQARVLQATSFRRKDLEPVLFEHPGTEGPTRKDKPPLPGVSEVHLPNLPQEIIRCFALVAASGFLQKGKLGLFLSQIKFMK